MESNENKKLLFYVANCCAENIEWAHSIITDEYFFSTGAHIY